MWKENKKSLFKMVTSFNTFYKLLENIIDFNKTVLKTKKEHIVLYNIITQLINGPVWYRYTIF